MPNEYPAVIRPCTPTMKPHARSSRRMSTMIMSMKMTQVDLYEETVNRQLTMNHAHMYMATAWLNSFVRAPVESVYAAMMPDPGRYIRPYEKFNAA
jgi:hypothetical protein